MFLKYPSLAWWVAGSFALAGCGARSGLDFPSPEAEALDAGVPERAIPGDAGTPKPDSSTPDSSTPDSSTTRVPQGCPPDSEINVLVLTSSATLYTFDPDSLKTTELGRVPCMGDANSMVFSRKGYALINDGSGNLYKVFVPSLKCEKIPFDAAQVDHERFGMGLMARDGQEEQLFVVRRFSDAELARIDTQTWKLTSVARIDADVGGGELEGTGDGRLFTLFVNGTWTQAEVAEIDPETAVLSNNVLINVASSNIHAFDFALWGGAFYTFTATLGSSRIDRYDARTGMKEFLGHVPFSVVGASTSTCAPL